MIQVLIIANAFRNYFYVLDKLAKPRLLYHPRTLLTVPCKGIDSTFEKNITSHFMLNYADYYLYFVVESESDPAYQKLCELKEKLSGVSKAIDIRILVAGLGQGCSQKIQNLLFSCSNAPEDVEIFAFADSDACLRSDWLSRLVHPLRKGRGGASTGYRWFVPQQNNLASLVLSSLNAKIAQQMGNSPFMKAWGGSMAINKKLFYEIGLDEIWKNALSDDLSLSWAVRKRAGKKIIFVPPCLVASYEKTTWPKLFEFIIRQFKITRTITPGTWWFGLLSILYSLTGLWIGAGVAVYAAAVGKSHLFIYIMMPAVFYVGQTIRPIIRQKMILLLLHEDRKKMRPAMYVDILGNFIWSWLLFVCIAASAFGKKIVWRGVEYEIISPTETLIKKR
jgi:ceramide glucosyltransferase